MFQNIVSIVEVDGKVEEFTTVDVVQTLIRKRLAEINMLESRPKESTEAMMLLMLRDDLTAWSNQ